MGLLIDDNEDDVEGRFARRAFSVVLLFDRLRGWQCLRNAW
jgi:hypothetical protein